MNAWKAHRSLTAEQKEILKKKEVTLERPVDELIAMLKPLAGYDRVVDKLRTPLGCSGSAAIAFALIGLFFIGEIPAMGAVVALLGVFAIFALWSWRWTKAVDLSNNLSATALPLLAVFREDIDPAHPVRLRLDLRPPLSPEKKKREEPPVQQGTAKITDAYYEDSWMEADATLQDGTRLRWNVTEHIRERTKTRRNPRGKIKTKMKYAKKCDIEVSVAMKKKAYDVAAPQGEDVSVKSDEKKNVVKVFRRVDSRSLDPVSPRAVIDAIVSVYRNARPAKEV